MSDVPLRIRVATMVVVALVLVAVAGLAVTVAVDRASSVRRDIDTRLQPAAGDARALERALVDQETGERGFVITGDRSFLEPYDAGRAQERRRSARLREAFADDEALLERVRRVEDAAAAWRASGPAPEIRARAEGRERLAERLVARGTGKRAFDRVRSEQEGLVAAIETRVVQAEESAADSERFLRDVLLGSTALLLLLVVAVAALLRRWLLVPVATLRRSLRRVAGGELTARVSVTGPPEVAAIGDDAEAMRRRLVEEVDNSRSALEALQQQSPVVAGMRAELAADPTAQIGGVSVAGVLRPMEGMLAGDWWQVVQRPTGTVALVVADVSGHGATAGLVALRFKHRLTTLLETELDLLRVFTLATRDLDTDPERFVTCLLVELDPGRRTLRYVNAGHPAGFMVRGEGARRVEELPPTGPIVSVLGGGWEVVQASMGRHDVLVAVTDGVLECRSASGAELGREAVVSLLRATKDLHPTALVGEVDQAVRSFAAGDRQDDVTVVAARWHAPLA